MIISERRLQIRSAKHIVDAIREKLDRESEIDRNKEHFWTIGVNNRNVIQYIDLVALGTLNSAPVHPREVYRLAVMKGVASIIVAHNHPGGDPEPSGEDKNITDRLKNAGDILGIKLLDHIVIGEDSFYSFSAFF